MFVCFFFILSIHVGMYFVFFAPLGLISLRAHGVKTHPEPLSHTSTWPDPAFFSQPVLGHTDAGCCSVASSVSSSSTSSSSSWSTVPPTATWLCCAPPTGGRSLLLLFPTSAKTQRTQRLHTEGVCVAFKKKSHFKSVSTTESHSTCERSRRKTSIKKNQWDLHPCSPLHLALTPLSSWSASALLTTLRALPSCVNPATDRWLPTVSCLRFFILFNRSLTRISEQLVLCRPSSRELDGLWAGFAHLFRRIIEGTLCVIGETGNYLALAHQRTAWWEFLPLFSVSTALFYYYYSYYF